MIKIQESMPRFLSKAIKGRERSRYGNKYLKNQIIGVLSKAGIDLNNPYYEDITDAKKSDPRFRGVGGALFYEIGEAVISYIDRQWMSSSYKIPSGPQDMMFSDDFYKLPINQKRDIADKVYFIPYKADMSLGDKRTDRYLAKKGSVDRYTNKTKPNRWVQLDKSGYVVNPDKYKRMLADMKISNLGKVIDDAASTYSKLASLISKVMSIDPDDRSNNFHNYHFREKYTDLMRYFPEHFKDLDRYNREYNKAHDKYGDEVASDRDDIFGYKKRLVDAIMDLRDTTNKAKQMIKEIEAMSA